MKDLVLTTPDSAKVGTLRVDMLSNSPANFTIMQMKNANNEVVDTLPALGNFSQRLPLSWSAFVAFCVSKNYRIQAVDNDQAEILSGYQAPAGTKYPIVSANGGTKTFLIATDVTSQFATGNIIKVYNSDNSLWGTFTHVSDSYSAPNTSIVVSETLTTIGVSSGKYIVKG